LFGPIIADGAEVKTSSDFGRLQGGIMGASRLEGTALFSGASAHGYKLATLSCVF
jgi:hypothetical protein